MPDTELTAAATAAVQDAFGATPVFACLTGSTAAGTDTPDSDIDLLVILPNTLPPAQAVIQRAKFTRNYIRLHTDFDRPPDLQWPGEVCYAADLTAAIDGGAFDLKSTPRLRLCPPDRPYRYWASMTARGTPIIGHTEFAQYASRCAATLIGHIQFNRIIAAMKKADQAAVTDAPEWGEWRIPSALSASVTRHFDERSDRDHLAWRNQLREPSSQPPLDQWTWLWREIAAEANKAAELTPQAQAKSGETPPVSIHPRRP